MQGRQRILCVEDFDEMLEVLAELLRSAGYEVVATRSVQEALDALRTGSFELVLTDYSLPDGNGLELLASARENEILGDARPVIFTAHSLRPSTLAPIVLRKPLDAPRLLDVIAGLLRKPRERPTSRSRASSRPPLPGHTASNEADLLAHPRVAQDPGAA